MSLATVRSCAAAISGVWHDVRYTSRSLRRNPGFTLASVLTLGLGIGATTAIFSVVNSVLFKPLHFVEPSRLAVLQFRAADQSTRTLWATYDSYTRQHIQEHITYPNFERWRDATGDVFEEMGVFSFYDMFLRRISYGAESELLPNAIASAGVFRALGVHPELGRWFADEDDLPEAPGVMMISHALWQRRFGGSASVIGSTVKIDDRQVTVIGVMPPDFEFPSSDAQFWVPMAWESRNSGSTNYSVLARVKNGVKVSRARAMLEARALEVEGRSETNWTHGATFTTLRHYLVGDVRPLLVIFMAAVATVLLIACVNVVNLMLTRSSARRHEHTVRVALGAGPRQLAQRIFTESAIVSLLGATLGLLLAFGLVAVLVVLAPGSIPRREEIGVDATALFFTLVTALVISAGIALIPAVRATRMDLASRLRHGTQATSSGARGNRLRSALVVTQLALALALMVSAGALVRSFVGLLTVEAGFQPQNVLAFETRLPRSGYATFHDRLQFYDELEGNIRALAGVHSAAVVTYLPARGWFNSIGFSVDGYSVQDGYELTAERKEIGNEYFSAMGIPLLEGRAFDGGDDESGEPVVIVNQYLARNYWQGGQAVGGTVRLEDVPHRVVGVVSDVRYRGAGMDSRHPVDGPRIYRPYAAGSRRRGDMAVVVRTSDDPQHVAAPIRRVVADIDPLVAVHDMQPLKDILSVAVSEPRFHTLVVGAFGLAAMLLSVVGVYGVMAYSVIQRTRELGVRMALGADENRIVRHVVGRGLAITGLGVGLGLIGALAVAGVLEGFLYNVAPRDPWTIGMGVVVLGCASMLACLMPALRAARVDPLIALRAD